MSSEEVKKVKKEIAKNMVKMRDDKLTEKELEELEREHSYLKQKLYYERLKETFERMGRRIDEKHKRR